MTSTGSGSAERNGLAALAVGVSAFCLSSFPLLIHLTAEDTGPFLFNVFVVLSMIIVMGLFLRLTKKRFVDDFLDSEYGTNIKIRDAFDLSYFERNRSNNRLKLGQFSRRTH